MSPFLKILFDEHEVIVNALDVAKQSSGLIGKDNARYEKTILQLLDFFRNYADSYHHNKEEKILFPAIEKANELLKGIINEMFENHEDFREILKNMEKFLVEKKYTRVQQQLELYSEKLLDHIAVENEEVFQIAETLFTEDELEKLSHRFDDCDRELGNEAKEKLRNLSDELRKQFVLTD